MVTVDEHTGPREARFLFLGGTRHRTWVSMPIEDCRDGVRPVEPTVVRKQLRDPYPEIYHGRRCESGTKNWWVYILADHDPSRSDILDAYPYLT